MRRRSGVTLVELMVVVGLIGLISAMAFASFQNAQPNARLKEVSSDLQGIILRARNEAVRSRLMHKVCLFRDSVPDDENARGRVLTFRCEGEGPAGCATEERICGNVPSPAPGTVFDEALFDADRAPNDCGVLPTGADEWCRMNDADYSLDFSDPDPAGFRPSLARYATVIFGFSNVSSSTLLPGGVSADLDALELTFGTTGTVNESRTSQLDGTKYTQGTILVTNLDLCTSPRTPEGCPSAAFSRYTRLRYVLGGGVRQ